MKEEEEEMAPMVEKTVFTNAGNAEVRWGLVRFYFFPSDTFHSHSLMLAAAPGHSGYLQLLISNGSALIWQQPMDTGQVNFVF